MNPHAPAFQPSQGRGNDDSFKQLIDTLRLSQSAVMNFDGDPLSYHVFMRAFDECIDASTVPPASKLNRLLELCTGKAYAANKI